MSAAILPLAGDTIIDASAVDYLILAIYFAFVLGIGLLAKRQVSDSLDFFLSGRSLPAWVTGSRVHLGQPRCRRDHGHVGVGCGVRAPDGALLLGRRDPRHAVPRRGDDAVLLRLQGALGPRVHAAPFRARRPPGQRDLVRGRAAADRRREPLPAGHDHPGAARLAALGGAARRGRRGAVLHHPRRPERRDLQRGPAVLRDRRGAAAADPARPAPDRWLGRPDGRRSPRPPARAAPRRPSSS